MLLKSLTASPDYHAPDGSEIRLLSQSRRGGLCHCTLPRGKTSKPVSHIHVEEIWYVLSGEGEVWRKSTVAEGIVQVGAGVSLTIPAGTRPLGFRSTCNPGSTSEVRCRPDPQPKLH
jgi:mannose-6-phosphate isomerase-like protein (cupin superfamily)